MPGPDYLKVSEDSFETVSLSTPQPEDASSLICESGSEAPPVERPPTPNNPTFFSPQKPVDLAKLHGVEHLVGTKPGHRRSASAVVGRR